MQSSEPSTALSVELCSRCGRPAAAGGEPPHALASEGSRGDAVVGCLCYLLEAARRLGEMQTSELPTNLEAAIVLQLREVVIALRDHHWPKRLMSKQKAKKAAKAVSAEHSIGKPYKHWCTGRIGILVDVDSSEAWLHLQFPDGSRQYGGGDERLGTRWEWRRAAAFEVMSVQVKNEKAWKGGGEDAAKASLGRGKR